MKTHGPKKIIFKCKYFLSYLERALVFFSIKYFLVVFCYLLSLSIAGLIMFCVLCFKDCGQGVLPFFVETFSHRCTAPDD